MPQRSYQHYCVIGRALDVIGDRWTLLVVRELCGGSRRYSDLFADLPGISTDMLASRLRGLEEDGLVTKQRVGPRASASVYALTDDGEALRPVLTALAVWGGRRLGERSEKDAIRAHWMAFPLGPAIAEVIGTGTVDVVIDGAAPFHVDVRDGVAEHHDGGADRPDAELHLTLETAVAIVRGERALTDADLSRP
ncbi:winged helix-turn-helix transcriptional regulator [Gordonia phthalatica]|uniref:Transcriptional regulator n=1 Tax=Gordonia phthalatica TaxID=1136941 RepID=A0A0N9N1T8_9ACTN|nr:helix-turn-helix domain-containing protein [Gordonia phthalatica]ALG84108.1 transcriptional regulator [Gordonia phthalatica]